MNNSNYQKFIDDNCGKWFDVTYIEHYYMLKYHVSDLVDICTCHKLMLDNASGMGHGTLFFANEENRLAVLNWAQIISMIPIKDK